MDFLKEYRSTTSHVRTANEWAANQFPIVAEAGLTAFVEVPPAFDGFPTIAIRDFNDSFFALALGPQGMPQQPTVYDAKEERFFRYQDGVYVPVTNSRLEADVAHLFDQCAAHFSHRADHESFARLKAPWRLSRVVQRARDLLSVADDFFADDWSQFLPLQNGIWDHSKQQFIPFDPKFTFKSKLPVKYQEGAKCEMIEITLKHIVSPDDLELLQRYFGQVLLGRNPSQKILLMTGDAAGGKGTVVGLVRTLIGDSNIGVLREALFTNQCELSRYSGKKLLVHPDCPTDFLNRPEAAVMKQIVGGDLMWADEKNSDEPVLLDGQFPVVLCSNGKMKIHIDEDIDAWRRRLAVVHFHTPQHGIKIGSLSQRLLKYEASGFLNWLLAGVQLLKKDNFQLKLSQVQEKNVNDLLLASDSPKLFARLCLQPSVESQLTVRDCYEGYRTFCKSRGVSAIEMRKFTAAIEQTIRETHGRNYRRDLIGENGKYQRGWKGLKWDAGALVRN